MEKKITLTNILSYVEGNGQLALERLNLQPQHIREQIAYRRYLCRNDCATTNQCVYCGCDFEGKTSVVKSCNNGERFPNLMSKPRWEKFKENNEII
jgi:hypothetical protein